MLVLLAIAYGLAYLDRLMMAVVAEPVRHEFGLSDKQLFALTGAAFVLIYGACSMIAGWLLDRASRARIIGMAMGGWSLATMACGFATGFPGLAAARAGVGVGEAAIVPAAMAMISDAYPPQKRPLAMGVFYAGGMVGVFVAWVAGSWVAAHYGWRSAFFLAGPPGIVLALLVLWKGREPEREFHRGAVRGRGTFADIARNTPLLWLLGAGSVLTFVNIGLINQLGSFFMRSHAMPMQQVGLIFGPVMAGGTACGLIGGGWIGNRLAARGVDALLRFSTINAFALFPIYMLVFLAPSKGLALVALFLGTIASVLYSPCFSAAYQAVSAPHTRATAAGISGFANALIGGALTTFLVGALSDHWKPAYGPESLRYAMMAGLVSCLISGAMFVKARQLVAQQAASADAATFP